MLDLQIAQYRSPSIVYATCKGGGGGTTCGPA
jgi:hypothetical protein